MRLTGSLLLRLAMVCRPYANDLSKASYPFTHFPLSLWFCLGSNEAHGWQPVRVCLPLFYSFRMESWSPSLCYPMGQWPNDGTRTFSAESLVWNFFLIMAFSYTTRGLSFLDIHIIVFLKFSGLLLTYHLLIFGFSGSPFSLELGIPNKDKVT